MTDRPPLGPPLTLVPRMSKLGSSREAIDRRRAWLEQHTGVSLASVGEMSLPAEALANNIENPIGAVQIPVGVAGPVLIHGEHAQGQFHVPLATTEGALVRSYERGMVTLSRAGGVNARILVDENRISPVFVFADVVAAHRFWTALPGELEGARNEVATTTTHGRLLRLDGRQIGREVIVTLAFSTGDAHGMNMIARAAERVCARLRERHRPLRDYLFGGLEGEKKASAAVLAGGKGKTVVAGASVPASLLRTHLHAEPEQLVDLWRRSIVGSVASGTVGQNGHFANGITAMFIACGQDVANVANACVGVNSLELDSSGELHASVTLSSLTVATVGGGTGLATARECLELLGCRGQGKARKLAEIVAATVLAGELSMGAAIVSGEFVAAHERYGRNRPGEATR